MKFSEYLTIAEFSSDDYLLTDGNTNGTRKIQVESAILSLLHTLSPYNHRTIFRGKNLGSSLTSNQLAAIQVGDFKDLWLGDYWQINGVNWRIVDFDYWYGSGDTGMNDHHLVIMPDTNLYSAAMNSTNTTTGGYLDSEMFTTNLANAKTLASNAFGESVLMHREYQVNVVTSGYPSGGTWTNSTVDLPSEIMIFGSNINAPASDGTTAVKRYTNSKTQLALFSIAPTFICHNRTGYWLRDVASATQFCNVGYYGSAGTQNASTSSGIRPVFAIG